MHRLRRYLTFQYAVFTPLFEWILMNQQLLALARPLISLDLLYLWCKHHDPHASPRYMRCIMRVCTCTRAGGARASGGACVYIHE